MDYVKGSHRGFAFIEYDYPDDAVEAIFNMDGAELLSRSIQVSMAQANQIHKLTSSSAIANASGGNGGNSRTGNNATEAIWKSDEWFQQYAGGGGGGGNHNSTNQSDDTTMTEAQKLKAIDTEILKGR